MKSAICLHYNNFNALIVRMFTDTPITTPLIQVKVQIKELPSYG